MTARIGDKARGAAIAQKHLAALAKREGRTLTASEIAYYEKLERQKLAAQQSDAILKRQQARHVGKWLADKRQQGKDKGPANSKIYRSSW